MKKHSSARWLAALAVLVAVLVSARPALAHHGWGGNEDKSSDLTATVTTPVSLAGPHATMKVKDARGQIWDITLAPPARTQEAGLKDGSLPVGSTVTLHGHRAKNPKTFEMKTTRLTFNGKLYDVYPGMD